SNNTELMNIRGNLITALSLRPCLQASLMPINLIHIDHIFAHIFLVESVASVSILIRLPNAYRKGMA
ncbi:MAG: hypothetical protein KGL09_11760, partial [Pseudomonadota bacterium]|nr:hypothetical protein [Pseudomonadota bacterium]